jgi:hypothetical protein
MNIDVYLIGWKGKSLFPSPHTIIRTGPYTAVHVDCCKETGQWHKRQ